MYERDPKSIDHKRLCAAVKAGLGDSFKAAEAYVTTPPRGETLSGRQRLARRTGTAL